MGRLDRTTIDEALLSAPGWARVGITATNERLREDAALELARAILDPRADEHADQLKLL